MLMRTLVSQTIFLSGTHFLVRVVGFLLRIWLSRELGAAAMGLVELAHSAQQLLITPVLTPAYEEVPELTSTLRGGAGFGSTGK